MPRADIRPLRGPKPPDQSSRRELLGGPGSHPVPELVRRVISRADVRPMRSPEAERLRNRRPRGAMPPPSLAVIALNRMTFGPRPGDVDAFNALGSTDTQRLQGYVDQQLNPGAIPDTDLQQRLSTSGYTTLNKSMAQLWADHVTPDPPWEVRMRPIAETQRVKFLRAAYSERQLFEVLAEFWHDHFSIYGWDFWIGPAFVAYDRDVIRANALGNFRTMLEGVAHSQAMLYYLDNYISRSDGPNENWARELCELHTMGAENYLGTIPAASVPTDGGGDPVAFVDEDIFGATKAFTGWTFDDTTGIPYFEESWHDTTQKTFLGQTLPAGQTAAQDGRQILDILASHPGTATYISRKLCKRLISDDPPESVVQAAAAVFQAQSAAPNQIAQVVRTILLSPEFRSTWGEKVKRPFELMVGVMRTGSVRFNMTPDDSETNTLMWRTGHTGHSPFTWRPPNGFPDAKEDWLSTSPLIMTWRAINWLVDERDADENYVLDIVGTVPSTVVSSEEMVDYWLDRMLGRAIHAPDRTELIDFMAQGRLPNVPLNWDTDNEIQDRVRSLVGLIALSPEYLKR